MSGRITLGTFGFAALSALLPDPAGARTSWASGTYIYELVVDGERTAKKMYVGK